VNAIEACRQRSTSAADAGMTAMIAVHDAVCRVHVRQLAYCESRAAGRSGARLRREHRRGRGISRQSGNRGPILPTMVSSSDDEHGAGSIFVEDETWHTCGRGCRWFSGGRDTRRELLPVHAERRLVERRRRHAGSRGGEHDHPRRRPCCPVVGATFSVMRRQRRDGRRTCPLVEHNSRR